MVGTKLTNPKKVKLNVPLVKEHIRILINSFAKKYDVNEIESFYFQGNDKINKEDFISKCQDVNSSISVGMYEKIFTFMKPVGDHVTSIAFKLCFSFDENTQIE